MNASLVVLTVALAVSGNPARTSSPVPSLPGWTLFSESGSHQAARDDDVTVGARPTARLSSEAADGKFGTLVQGFDAANFRGKRVRFAGEVKTAKVKGWAGLQVAIEGFKKRLSYENTQNRAVKGDSGWTALSVVLDVPDEAKELWVGVTQDGAGTSWFGRLSFEVVDASVPLTRRARATPLDLGFEDAELGGWFLSGGGRKDYVMTLVSDVRHGGQRALKLTAAPGADLKKYGTAMQFFDGEPFVGKRVRASVWLKSDGLTDRGDFWVRCQGPDTPAEGPGLGGGYGNADLTSEWTQYTAVFVVPEGTKQIELGVGMAGGGTLWADDVVFEVVPSDTPLRSGRALAPRNLDFTKR